MGVTHSILKRFSEQPLWHWQFFPSLKQHRCSKMEHSKPEAFPTVVGRGERLPLLWRLSALTVNISQTSWILWRAELQSNTTALTKKLHLLQALCFLNTLPDLHICWVRKWPWRRVRRLKKLLGTKSCNYWWWTGLITIEDWSSSLDLCHKWRINLVNFANSHSSETIFHYCPRKSSDLRSESINQSILRQPTLPGSCCPSDPSPDHRKLSQRSLLLVTTACFRHASCRES